MKNSQKGLTRVAVLLVAIVALIVVGVYFCLQNNKTPPATKMSVCNYVYQPAEFFLATTTDYLLIDSGTAPDPRGLTFYDLNKCEKVLTVRYSRPVDVTDVSVTYWEPVEIKPTIANCPDLATWTTEGLGAGIESHVTVSLNDLSKKSLNQFRCSARQ